MLIDDSFRASMPVRELPRLVWFGVYCRQAPDSGFWHPDEAAGLDAIEQDLVRLCDQFGRGWAVYVLRIDTRGIREYFLYCGGSAALAQVLPSLRAAHPENRIEFDETSDSEWNRYKTFLPNHEPAANHALKPA